ncbi:MAG: glycosyltransferase family 4 protein [Deltaproteobacteria bacterium]
MWSIVHTEWSSGFGGQEKRILLESREMIRRGHRVTIACRPESRLFPRACEAGIPAIPIPFRSSADIRSVAMLARWFRRERIDIVNTHSGKDSWIASTAAKLAGVPLLIRTRHISVPIRRGWFNMVYRWPDGYITTASMIRDHLIEKGIPPERIVSIPTGVETDRFHPGTGGACVRRELGIGPEEPVLSIIGVLRSWKRHDLFLETVRILKNRGNPVRALIAGEGPQQGKILSLIRDRGLADCVTLMGFREDIPEVLAATDVAVLTSDRFEGVPQIVLQAMASGRPVVASPIGGIPEVVRAGETGMLCEPGNAESFAGAVERLLADPELRRRMGENGRASVVAEYSVEAMGSRTERFYEELVSGSEFARRRAGS